MMAINTSRKVILFTNKWSVKTEYFKRVESGNVFQAINICGVPTVRYEAGTIQWAK